jgi:acetyltransferase-like isoleucine patch superfamily enzyme
MILRERGLLRRALREPGPAGLSLTLLIRCRLAGVQVDDYVLCSGGLPRLTTAGSVRFGRGANFRSATVRSEVGAELGARLDIGADTFVNQGVSLVAHRSITIGAGCRIGELCAIFDTNHHELEPGSGVRAAAVVLSDNVWLGRGVIVLPGVTMGANSVAAAGSVVTRDVPADVLVGGNPARILRRLTVPPGWRRH